MIVSSKYSDEVTVMIALKHIDKIKWSSDLGKRLTKLRGDLTRKELESATEKLGHKVGWQYLHQLENPQSFEKRLKSGYLTVSMEAVEVLCKALNVEITDLLESAKFYSKNP